jgi:hypothetical protein
VAVDVLQKVYRIALNIVNVVVSYIIVYCSIIKLININALKYACDFHRRYIHIYVLALV